MSGWPILFCRGRPPLGGPDAPPAGNGPPNTRKGYAAAVSGFAAYGGRRAAAPASWFCYKMRERTLPGGNLFLTETEDSLIMFLCGMDNFSGRKE